MNQLECFEDAYKSDKIKFTNLFCLRAIITNEKETKMTYKVKKTWRILMHLSWRRNNYIITYPRVGILGVDECWFLHKLHWPEILGVFVQFATESCRQGCCFNFEMKHDANRPVNYMRYPQDRNISARLTSLRESKKQYHTKQNTQTAIVLDCASRALLLLRSFLQDSPAHIRVQDNITEKTYHSLF